MTTTTTSTTSTTTTTTSTTSTARERACASLKALLTRRGVLRDNPVLLRERGASGIYFPLTQEIIWNSGSPTWCKTLTHESVHLLQHLPGGGRLRGEPQKVNPNLPEAEASRIREEVQDYYPQSQWAVEYGAWSLEHEPEVVLKLLEQSPPPPPPAPWQGLPTPLGVGLAVAASALMTWLMLRVTK